MVVLAAASESQKPWKCSVDDAACGSHPMLVSHFRSAKLAPEQESKLTI